MKAFDTPESTAGNAHELAGKGYGAVFRYISPNTHNFPTKQLTKAEADGLHSVGIKIGSVFEDGYPTDVSYFSFAKGVSDAREAIRAALEVGQPLGSAIYFAVDFDAPDSQFGPILAYFEALHPVVKDAGYLVGAYGSGRVIGNLFELGWCHYRWLASATGWAGYDLSGVDVAQSMQGNLDFDETMTDAGLW